MRLWSFGVASRKSESYQSYGVQTFDRHMMCTCTCTSRCYSTAVLDLHWWRAEESSWASRVLVGSASRLTEVGQSGRTRLKSHLALLKKIPSFRQRLDSTQLVRAQSFSYEIWWRVYFPTLIKEMSALHFNIRLGQ
jgi:hypothetical protein